MDTWSPIGSFTQTHGAQLVPYKRAWAAIASSLDDPDSAHQAVLAQSYSSQILVITYSHPPKTTHYLRFKCLLELPTSYKNIAQGPFVGRDQELPRGGSELPIHHRNFQQELIVRPRTLCQKNPGTSYRGRNFRPSVETSNLYCFCRKLSVREGFVSLMGILAS
jgi:hypothetical protein